jgi:chaperonin GroES
MSVITEGTGYMETVVPLYSKLLVSKITEDDKTAGGLFIPGSVKDRPNKVSVIAVGDGRITPDGKILPLLVKPGDTVLLQRAPTVQVIHEGKTLYLVNEDDVLAIIR